MTDRHPDPDRARRLARLERIRHRLPRQFRDMSTAEIDRRLQADRRARRRAAKQGSCNCGQ